MNGLLVWARLNTLPGLVPTAFDVPTGQRCAGWASLAGPFVFLLAAIAATLARQATDVVVPKRLPVPPDGASPTQVDALLGFVASRFYVYSLGLMAAEAGKRRLFVYLVKGAPSSTW